MSLKANSQVRGDGNFPLENLATLATVTVITLPDMKGISGYWKKW